MSKRARWGSTRQVKEYWERESCGERYGGPLGREYERIDAERYRLEPQIADFAKFGEPFLGTAVEIGLGTGADFCRNVARGGHWFGVELTAQSLGHVVSRLASSEGLVQADAQYLPLSDDSIDLVYSWGVLLCCPHIRKAVDELWRVLRLGGEARVMLYHAPSWVAVAAWLRWGWWRGLSPKLSVTYMESPGTRAFSLGEARSLFGRFSEVTVRPVHTSWDEKWLGPIGRIGGDRLGWFLLCRLTK